MALVLILAAAVALIAFAPTARAAEVLPASGELGCDDLRRNACEFFDPSSGLAVRLPRDWTAPTASKCARRSRIDCRRCPPLPCIISA